MADKALKGNGVDCPACELQREAAIDQASMERSVPCNFCAGTGRVGIAVSAIILEAVTWAAENYWPERERLWAVENPKEKPTEADQ
jgi:hypothetical protein